MIAKEQDCVNPTTKGKLTWEHDNSCASNSEEELENWHNRIHEVSTRNCAQVTKSVFCMTSEVCNLPSYDVLGDVNIFLDEYEEQVPENQRLLALDIALKVTPARWWGAHKKNIEG